MHWVAPFYTTYRYALFVDSAMACCWKGLPKTQEKLKHDCLEHHCERWLKRCDWSSTQVSLFLLAEEAGKVNIQSCGMRRYLSRLAI